MGKKFFQQKNFKFLLGGGIAATLNLGLIFLFIEYLNFDTPFLRNVANAVSVEISLLFSFFIYRIWVWQGGVWKIEEVLLRQIPLYHVFSGGAIVARIFFLFPILDWLDVNYLVNTFIGILLSVTLNYLISDRWIFKIDRNSQLEMDYPEGLAPALESNAPSEKSYSREKGLQFRESKPIALLSVVIPAYNEEGCIVSTIDAIAQLLDRESIAYEILVVNDNSRDRTEELLQQIVVRNHQVRYINNYYPNGFGFAVRCGLENFQGDAVAIVMADRSDSPENIVDYYYKLQEGYDCIFGSRFIRGGKVFDYPLHKLIVNRSANLFIQILFGLKLNDTTNAFKIYRKEVIEGISPLISHHFNLTVEMPLKAIARGYSYATIPITWQNRAAGISKLKLKEMGSRYLFIVLYIWLEKHLSRGDYVCKNSQAIAVRSQAQ